MKCVGLNNTQNRPFFWSNSMKIKKFSPGSWLSNCYIFSVGSHAIVIDPSETEIEIRKYLNDNNLTLDRIILTHGHFDHMSSCDTLRKTTGAPLYIHSADAEFLLDSRKNAFSLFFAGSLTYRPADGTFKDGDTFVLGDKIVEIINTPGHTDGSICILCDNIMFTGDTLFENNTGRCDFYSGSFEKMNVSLQKLSRLDKSICIYPGHEGATTLGQALRCVL